MMSEAIDWGHAAARAALVTKAGPPIDREGLLSLVASLRSAASDAPSYVADITGLTEAANIAAEGTVLVVDRPRWSQAVTETFAAMMGDSLPAPRVPGAAKMVGEQLGWVLAVLSTRILGQFDPYVTTQPGTGRLFLVAPNVLTVQRQIDADPEDFHLWVCLHEQTHAVQFAAAPWLADHLEASLRSVVQAQVSGLMAGADHADEDEPEQLSDDEITEPPPSGEPLLARLVALVRSEEAQVPGLLELMLPEEQRDVLARAVAVMSLLEGHADVVMDEVGPGAIPTVRAIRTSFERRRDERTMANLIARRVLGMDAKLLQYRNGADFVRGVIERVGHRGLNAVWTGPEFLPTPEEIADPASWVARVHG